MGGIPDFDLTHHLLSSDAWTGSLNDGTIEVLSFSYLTLLNTTSKAPHNHCSQNKPVSLIFKLIYNYLLHLIGCPLQRPSRAFPHSFTWLAFSPPTRGHPPIYLAQNVWL
jgi:hypothetical protein